MCGVCVSERERSCVCVSVYEKDGTCVGQHGVYQGTLNCKSGLLFIIAVV